MTVLVTGAGGFLGGIVAEAFARNGHGVLAGYRNTRPEHLNAFRTVQLVQADLTFPIPVTSPLDAIVHCAADIPARAAGPAQIRETNVGGMHNLLQLASKTGATCFLAMSSMSAFGRIDVETVDLDTPSQEPDDYGASKLEAEALLAAWTGEQAGRAAVSFRLPGVVGRGSHDNFLSNTLAAMLKNEPVRAVNPDARFNNIVHARDLANFLVELSGRAEPGHRITTIAAHSPMTIAGVLEAMRLHSGSTSEIAMVEGGKKPFLISLDACRSLGYRPASVAGSIERFVADTLCAAIPV